MPTDVDALLAYGYDLGGPSGWMVRGVDRDRPFNVPWWDGGDGEDGESFTDAACDELRYARRTQPEADVAGISVVWYGSDTRHNVPIGYILAARVYHQYYSGTRPTSRLDLTPDPAWDVRLRHALIVLGIQPTVMNPMWLLAASHGI